MSIANATKLCYFRNSDVLSGCAVISESLPGPASGSSNEIVIRLDQTVFYPQGGGQPSDKGSIGSDRLQFSVSKVVYQGELVDHIGVIQHGTAEVGDKVTLQVDEKLRIFHNRLHSAGHVVDAALAVTGVTNLIPGKAYHYADGPYVQYSGDLHIPKDEFKNNMQSAIDELLEKDLPVFIEFANDDPADTRCERKMRIGDILSIPCGGTHVHSLKETGKVVIRKVECKKGTVKVCYQIADG